MYKRIIQDSAVKTFSDDLEDLSDLRKSSILSPYKSVLLDIYRR